MSRRRVLLGSGHVSRLMVGILAGAIVSLGAESAGATEATLEGPNVIHYGQPYELHSTDRFIAKGEQLPGGGCQWKRSEAIEHRDVAEIEIAYDPTTCESLFVRGTWADENASLTGKAETAERSGAASSSASSSALATGGNAASAIGGGSTPPRFDPIPPGSNPRYLSAYAWTWYDEPARWAFGLDIEDAVPLPLVGSVPPVNSFRNWIEWWPNGDCTVPVGYLGWFRFEGNWLSESGWKLEYHDWYHTPELMESCSQPVYSRSYAGFVNNFFCNTLGDLLIPFTPFDLSTRTVYSPNGVEGYRDGTARWTSLTAKRGYCTNFLRLGARYGYGDGVGEG